MLKIAKNKIKNNFLEKKIKVIIGDSHFIPFQKNTFDIVTISFGLRNFKNIHLSLKEIYKILKPFGILEILEFSKPKNFFIKKIYHFYSNFILTKIGSFFSKNYFAYKYLKESINFFSEKKIQKIIIKNKFHHIQTKKLTFGIVSIYLFQKII